MRSEGQTTQNESRIKVSFHAKLIIVSSNPFTVRGKIYQKVAGNRAEF